MREEIRTFPKTEQSPMSISMAGITFPDSGYYINRPNSSITVMEYIVEGEGFVKTPDGEVAVCAGHIYILKKGLDHYYRSSPVNPWKKIFINMVGDLPVKLMREYGFTDEWLFDGEGLLPVFERIEQLLKCNVADASIQSQLVSMFLYVVSYLGMSKMRTAHGNEATRLKDYLDNNTDRIVGNVELASHIFRSPDYCVKLFRREYGTTPYDYQLNEKLRIARRLLGGTTMPVAEIAASVGFDDPKYFSRLFRQKCGISLREYRKSTQLG